MSDAEWMSEARMIAAQCWCDEDTSNRPIDVALAEAVAKRIAAWMDTEEFYRGLAAMFAKNLDRCAAALGPEVFVSDDGSVQDSPLRLKVPELVERLAREARAAAPSR